MQPSGRSLGKQMDPGSLLGGLSPRLCTPLALRSPSLLSRGASGICMIGRGAAGKGVGWASGPGVGCGNGLWPCRQMSARGMCMRGWGCC